ncbi:MAG: CvpA family protein [Methylomonas sp.]|jgi:membrane protein required for colicin V production
MADFLPAGNWVWLDYVLAGIVLFSALLGFIRGFIKEVFSLLIWITAIWAGGHYSHDFSAFFQNVVSYPQARIALSFTLLFIAILLLGGIINHLLRKLARKTGLRGSDRFLGMGFGIARGVAIIALLVVLAGFTPVPEQPWWSQSRLLPPFKTLAVWLKDRVPSNVADYMKFR